MSQPSAPSACPPLVAILTPSAIKKVRANIQMDQVDYDTRIGTLLDEEDVEKELQEARTKLLELALDGA